MSEQTTPIERLKKYRLDLARLEPLQSTWPKFQAWIASIRPFLRRHFPQDMVDFEPLSITPSWHRNFYVAVASQSGVPDPTIEAQTRQARQQELQSNNRRVENAKAGLLAFLDALLEVFAQPAPAPPAGESTSPNSALVERMPFRPYKRAISQKMTADAYYTQVQKEAFESSLNDQELQRLGGRLAVLTSIRKHLPNFDPAEAQEPYAPAWVRLKPTLVRSGLNPVDETTTLTDIKAFLDATEPQTDPKFQGQPAEVDHAMPDPKRVFVIYGRNEAAYSAMTQFLRAIKLDPKPFSEVSAECGASPTVLQIVRHGVEQAQGVVALFTPDEWSVLRPTHDPKRGTGEGSRRWQARPNVIFEAGLALGMAPERTVLVKLGGEVTLFSDVGGIHTVNLDNNYESRHLLRGKLHAAGCGADMTSGVYLDTQQAGDFVTCVQSNDCPVVADPFVASSSEQPPPAVKRPRKKQPPG